MLRSVEWGEFKLKDIFNNIKQGKRLKKEDQLPGDLPFVMAGRANTGVVNYISNQVTRFPENSITVDIFGNTFFRNYAFGAGDDTGVYWNSNVSYSDAVMLFFAISLEKALRGRFSYGKKLRSSKSSDFKINLPAKNGKINFEYMERFIAELEAYLQATGLKDYKLTEDEQTALDEFDKVSFENYNIIDVFNVKNSIKI